MPDSFNVCRSSDATSVNRFFEFGRRKHAERHRADHSHGTDNTSPNDRSIRRADRDVSIIMRGVGREVERLTNRLGDNAEAVDKIKTLAGDFEKSVKEKFDKFVEGGGQDYLSFAQDLAVSRRELRAQFREVMHNSPAPQPTDTTTPPPNTTDTRVIDRARRDVDSLFQGLDREFGYINQQFSGQTDLLDKVNAYRTDFTAQVQKELQSFEESGSSDYLSFAERLVTMRYQFGRSVQDVLTSGSPTTPPTDNTGGTTPPPPGPTDTTTPPPVANETNIARAKRDFEALVRGLDRESQQFLGALTGTDEGEKVKSLADSFRSFMDKKLNDFIQGGGQDYLSFAEELASARRSLSGQFRVLAGPKVDIHG